MEDMARAYAEFMDTLQSYLGANKAEDPEEGMAEREDLRTMTLTRISTLKVEDICKCLASDLAAFASVCVGVRCINAVLRMQDLEGVALIDTLHSLALVDGLPLVALKPEGKALLDKLLANDQGRLTYRDMACLLAEARKHGMKHICEPPCSDLSSWKVQQAENDNDEAGEGEMDDLAAEGAEA